MKLEDIQKRFDYKALQYQIRLPLEANEILAFESQLGITFPFQIREFYQFCNGFLVVDPQIEVLSVNDLQFLGSSRLLRFAQIYGKHDLCFDTTHLNTAEQWSIVTADDGFEITKTIGSFLTNRIWGFIESKATDWFGSVISMRREGPIEAQLVWIFTGENNHFSGGVFTTKQRAEEWIATHCLSGTLSVYPLDVSLYEYSIRNGHFMPKGEAQTSSKFIGQFSGFLDHYHYELGQPL